MSKIENYSFMLKGFEINVQSEQDVVERWSDEKCGMETVDHGFKIIDASELFRDIQLQNQENKDQDLDFIEKVEWNELELELVGKEVFVISGYTIDDVDLTEEQLGLLEQHYGPELYDIAYKRSI